MQWECRISCRKEKVTANANILRNNLAQKNIPTVEYAFSELLKITLNRQMTKF
jgi:hypothetical protein